MAKYRVVAVDRVTGQEGRPVVDAETPAMAAEIVAGRGYITGDVIEATEFPEDFQPGKALAKAAMDLGAFGIVLFPLAVVGLIAASCAIDRSNGKYGHASMALCRGVVALWFVLVLAIIGSTIAAAFVAR